MNKKLVFGGLALGGLLLYAGTRSPKFSVELIDKLNKKIKYIFDGQTNVTGETDSTTVQSKSGYTLIAQGDANGVLFTLYKGDTVKKRLPVLYNSITLPNKL